MQIARGAGGGDVVMAQVMFAHVAGLETLKHEGGRDVRVRLADRAYDATNAIRPRRSGGGFERAVFDEYAGKIGDLLEALDETVRAGRWERVAARHAAGRLNTSRSTSCWASAL